MTAVTKHIPHTSDTMHTMPASRMRRAHNDNAHSPFIERVRRPNGHLSPFPSNGRNALITVPAPVPPIPPPSNRHHTHTPSIKLARCPNDHPSPSPSNGPSLHQTGTAPQQPPQRLDSATPHLPTSTTSNTTSAQCPPHQHEAQLHQRDVRSHPNRRTQRLGARTGTRHDGFPPWVPLIPAGVMPSA